MIILTSQQAAQVRGISPTVSYAALDPVPLRDGTFMLPEEVINDPAHADVKALLQSCPTATPDATNTYQVVRAEGDTFQTYQAKAAAVGAEVAALNLPAADTVRGS